MRRRHAVLRWSRRCLLAALALAALAPSTAGAAATARDFQLVRDKYKEMLTGGSLYTPTVAPYSSQLQALNTRANALWRSMDLSGGRTSIWPDLATSAEVQATYERLRTLTFALKSDCTGVTGCLYENATMKSDIMNALDWLYTNWYNAGTTSGSTNYGKQIGVPLALTDTMVMLYGDAALTSTRRTNYLTALNAQMRTGYYSFTDDGGNRAWQAHIFIVRGVLAEREADVDLGLDGLETLLHYQTVPGKNGFWWDGSYFDHAYHPYSGGYGIAYFQYTAGIVYLLDGHPLWDVTDPDVANLVRWAFDAYQPLIYRGGMFDFMRGRSIDREEESDHNAGGWAISAYLLLTDFASSGDALRLKQLVKEWIAKDPGWYTDFYTTPFSIYRAQAIVNDSAVVAQGDQQLFKHYPMMYKSFSHRPGYAFGLSMVGYESYNYETIGSTNPQGWHTADGMTLLYAGDDIDQYRGNYWTTVNMYRLPGTTVQENTQIPDDRYNDDTWVAGTGDGTYGVSGMYLRILGEPLSAKKSWFMFDDEIVALGSDIDGRGHDPLVPEYVETIVDNRKLNARGDNAFTVDGTAKSTTSGSSCRSYRGWSETMTGVRWMHLAGNAGSTSDVGWYFPSATTVDGQRMKGCGAWDDINVKENHFLTTSLNHGRDPADATYAYVVLPGYSSAQTQTYRNSPETTVLRHDNSVHAVFENAMGLVGANFWTDTSQSIQVGRNRAWITVDRKATVLAQDRPISGTWYTDLAIADATRVNTGTITVEFGYPVAVTGHTLDAGMRILQTTPTLRVSVDVNGSKGKTFRARFRD